jgi:hypothetical protein
MKVLTIDLGRQTASRLRRNGSCCVSRGEVLFSQGFRESEDTDPNA